MDDEAGDGPRTSRGERTAARLRMAAREAFATIGYAGARVEDITAIAGVSHGTFYTYFDNKSAVLDSLVTLASERLLTVVDESWEGNDVWRTVQDVITRFVDALAEEGDVISAWIEAASNDQHFRDELRTVRGQYTDAVASHLADVLVDTPHDPVVAAGALVAMVEGYTVDRLAVAGSEGRTAAVTTLATIWVGGLIRMAGDRSRG
ncbi:TetR/AcrR family transcriptional regulator [Salsipaludibacter albus]|uniref:TetR/AcrR family transcriptional regulator n=1 Tax=Salsipaludibacter albus TaxID=2849650 RepID=UPI001EE46138|nr:TetR/AcrR family transcriptional regulator [Salsipaludibacter albus]MBY5163225.1 TetR/AcrR family transcriptional regulator [Salsipaludibacter albus]